MLFLRDQKQTMLAILSNSGISTVKPIYIRSLLFTLPLLLEFALILFLKDVRKRMLYLLANPLLQKNIYISIRMFFNSKKTILSL